MYVFDYFIEILFYEISLFERERERERNNFFLVNE
jgi:hypothetical protein